VEASAVAGRIFAAVWTGQSPPNLPLSHHSAQESRIVPVEDAFSTKKQGRNVQEKGIVTIASSRNPFLLNLSLKGFQCNRLASALEVRTTVQ
jgi:hypothetical protein